MQQTNVGYDLKHTFGNAKWEMFQPYQGKNKLHFDEMISALYETNTLI
jgi:hypothetical protein